MKKIVLFFFLVNHLSELIAQQTQLENIAQTFYQDAANNCASVALIKAAMLKYGFNNVLSVSKKDNEYKVKYRNGEKLTLTEDERLLAIDYAKFWINDSVNYDKKDSVIFYAYLYYACIAKYIEKNGWWDCEYENGETYKFRPIKDYKRSLNFISRTSYCTDNCHRLLGLSIKTNRVQYFNSESKLSVVGVVLYSSRHAVAVFNNQLDCFGDWENATTNRICGNLFRWFIELE